MTKYRVVKTSKSLDKCKLQFYLNYFKDWETITSGTKDECNERLDNIIRNHRDQCEIVLREEGV